MECESRAFFLHLFSLSYYLEKVLSASANISGGVSPFIAAYFILHFGWRFSVLIAGVVSIILGLISFCAVINSPTDVGMVTFAKPPRKDSISSM